ncbi:MAG TPA: 1-deoxy-D-xylulose-5-phosphate synthase [Thermoleophilia bacterium]|nr:1-deoxy-D-xylulose-5-phosphate synthase [Thermoleophilia bacterium]
MNGANARLLDRLHLPEDLRTLDPVELRQLAAEVRAEIIDSISCVGGHLGPSLGVVELTIALHAELRSPYDKIVWDVGHQSYAHKLLTGRADRFATIRTYGGLSGFPKPSESEHDAFGTGHSSTSVSVGVGLAEAARLSADESDRRVFAVIGDGALTGGMAYEAMNQAGHLRTPLVVVLNDNEMSIKKNVGAISSYLSRLRTEPTLYRWRRDLERRVQKFPGIGERVYAMGEHVKEGVKAALVPGVLFEELGFQYIGVVDGHDIEALRLDIRRAMTLDGPVLLHVRTIKGKGYSPAEKAPDRFHGISPFSIPTGECAPGSGGPPSYTEVFGKALVALARRDDRVVGITAAMAAGTGLDHLEQAFPERFFDVGIAEGHAVGFAAGLAAGGLRPVVALYSTFLQRAYDQVIHDVCLPGLPVVFAIDRAGLVGEDGPTHHGAFDLSFLRAVPGLTILVPKDEAELQSLLATALSMDSPVALRYPRGRGLGVPLRDHPIPIEGPWVEMLRTGGGILLLGTGTGVALALAAAEALDAEGIPASVANVRKVHPLDDDELRPLLETHLGVVTVEENTIVGGFGSAVAELMQRTGIIRPMEFVGLPDEFVTHGDMRSLYGAIGFTVAGVQEAAMRVLARSGAGAA